MTDLAAYVGDWLHLLFRWGHLIAAIGWVGTSFYFISLDLGLIPSSAPGLIGEAWEIHGGGFYRIEKFRLAPERIPLSLRWFKWEAYLTWLTGFALLILLYYLDPYGFLIDPRVLDLEPWQAVAASIALLGLGWIAYDQLARALEDRPRALAIALVLVVVGVVLIASAVFGSRAAYIHAGATLGTWMAANVLFVIIPGQRELIKQVERASGSARASESIGAERLAASERSEPTAIEQARWAMRGKQRSVHNNYLTLPVLFAMISQHFPFTYGHAAAPLVLLALMAAGATAQHFLNRRHQGRTEWPVLAAAGAIALTVAVAIAPSGSVAASEVSAADRAEVMPIVKARCVPCHARSPTQPGITAPPKGLMLESPEQVRANARRLYQQTVVTRVMPLGNQTGMTDAERETLARWFRAGAPLP